MLPGILWRGIATIYLWSCQIMHWCHRYSSPITGSHKVVDESGFCATTCRHAQCRRRKKCRTHNKYGKQIPKQDARKNSDIETADIIKLANDIDAELADRVQRSIEAMGSNKTLTDFVLEGINRNEFGDDFSMLDVVRQAETNQQALRKSANHTRDTDQTASTYNVISDREFNDRLYRQGLELCDKPCLHGDCFFQAILLSISQHNNDFPSNLTISNLRISAAKWLRANHRATHPDGSCLYQKMDNTRFRSWEEMCRKIETTHEGADTLVHLALSATLSCEFVFFTNRDTGKWVVRMGASLVAYTWHRCAPRRRSVIFQEMLCANSAGNCNRNTMQTCF
jgi:hypothetical protein